VAYYVDRVAVPADQAQQLNQLKLVPGMPAEVFIQTRECTPLDYLLKPLTEQLARTFRER
jgi:HlyD family secretion protein